ncbi:hypothetical protein CTEN210_13216 [Chaetoceros tenuissimus]|uniref:Uncharacterized protein n=1 Tax=Chaetoceros tenuissimus TaxID=426638 RepID=A0AAD3D562_9STRA|nr:hypothetical protein CTEN210_13216 [Chaetoceros tenuissimus]
MNPKATGLYLRDAFKRAEAHKQLMEKQSNQGTNTSSSVAKVSDPADNASFLSDLCLLAKWTEARDFLNQDDISNDMKKEQIQWKEWKDKKYGLTTFNAACGRNAPFDIINLMINLVGKSILFEATLEGLSPLSNLVQKNINPNMEVLRLILDVGGKEVLFQTCNKLKYTVLHHACNGVNENANVIKLLINTGGNDLLLQMAAQRVNCLHTACINDAILDIIKILVEAGGKDLVLATSAGNTSLHFACRNNGGTDVVKLLLDVGGKDLLFARDARQDTVLHTICMKKASIESVRLMVEAGGKDILLAPNKFGETAFHVALKKSDAHGPQLLKYFVEKGGIELLNAQEIKSGQTCLDRIKILDMSGTKYQSEEWKPLFALVRKYEHAKEVVANQSTQFLISYNNKTKAVADLKSKIALLEIKSKENEKKLQEEIEDLHQDITIMQLEQDEAKEEVKELTQQNQQYKRKIEKLENEIMDEYDQLKKAHTGSDSSDEDVASM